MPIQPVTRHESRTVRVRKIEWLHRDADESKRGKYTSREVSADGAEAGRAGEEGEGLMAFEDPFPPENPAEDAEVEVGYHEGDGLRRCCKCAHMTRPTAARRWPATSAPAAIASGGNWQPGAERERRDIGGPT